MKRYVGFTDEDAATLKEIAPVMEKYIPSMVNKFYEKIQSHEGTMEVITGGEEQIERLKKTLTTWAKQLFELDYNEDFAEKRFQIGYRHVELELDQKYVISAIGVVSDHFMGAAVKEFKDDPEKLERVMNALEKALSINLNLMCETYTIAMHEKLSKQEQQNLDNFLKITGMSKKLYENMAKSYQKKQQK
jgi:hemoglobin-like flavoprotein